MHQQFNISKNPQYLHSHLQHFTIIEQNDENFLEVVVECLMILKEYFPSKIEIELVSDLAQIYNLKKLIQQQIPRRLTGHLKMLAEKGKNQKLQPAEFDRLMYVLGDSIHKDYRHKLRLLALKIINQSKFDEQTWNQLTKQRIDLIDEIANDQLYQTLGIQVLEKIVRFNQFKDVEDFTRQKENVNPNICQKQIYIKNECKIDIKTAFFQLKESISIHRVCRILQTILDQSLNEKKEKKLEGIMKDIYQKLHDNFYYQATISEYQHLNKVVCEFMRVKKYGKNNQLFRKMAQIIKQNIKMIQSNQDHELNID